MVWLMVVMTVGLWVWLRVGWWDFPTVGSRDQTRVE